MSLPCQSGPPDRFFPGHGWSSQRVDAVKAECTPCPIREACLNWALTHFEQGIWAGTTEQERKQLRYIQSGARAKRHAS